MRKNGVNRQIYSIEGGICAPGGFKVGGVPCGIRDNGENDLALLISEKKCKTACVYSQLPNLGAPIGITKKHLYNGLAQAVLINGGVANVFMPEGEQIADGACRLAEKYFNVSFDDVVIASTGEIGKPLRLDSFETGLISLRTRMGNQEGYNLAAAEAIASPNEKAKTAAYSFYIGDFLCKIGVLYKGNMHVCPNMATTLIFLTTDVNISSAMLSRSLSAEVRETVNMLNLDGTASPNDTVCIMTNGRAENSLIDRVDSEYNKFTLALRAVLREVCRSIAQEGKGRTIQCKAIGAKSKQLARAVAKTLVGSAVVKDLFVSGEVDLEGIMYLLFGVEGFQDFARVQIFLQANEVELVLYEDEMRIPYNRLLVEGALNSKDVTLCVRLGNGNYDALAYGCAPAKDLL
ncbi:MAG: bifunctional ornithine acetyltransferase/N-acetylglutamate synthase [Clostridia bacterium]|nr:bifunctional ornithine acetyltransferase/N-acetylglutamate synthase [Clostridia bacterium]